MQKTKRLVAIEKIISEDRITSQESLLKKLKVKGIMCTQATLSRNLRQLGIIRLPDGAGNYRYSLPETLQKDQGMGVKLNVVPVIREIVDAKGLVLIKTVPGNASATAYCIDNASRWEIAGTIAGDDTILVIPRDGIKTSQVHTCLEVIFPGVHKKAGLSGRTVINTKNSGTKTISNKT
jgi:transcriptional regulator of arginine metabolism